MKRIEPWLAPLLLVSVGAAYLLLPRFSLGVNQVCEMLTTGNSRGIMMVLHAAGAYGALASIGIGCMAFLLLPLKPHYLLSANMGFFGNLQGAVLTALGELCAAAVILMLWETLWWAVPEGLKRLLMPVIRHRLTVPAILIALIISRIV